MARGPMPLTRKKGSPWTIPLVGAICVLLFMLARTFRDEAPPGTVVVEPPAEALGRWVTQDPRYADRGLRIESRNIGLETGPDDPDLHGEIQVVSVWPEGEATVVHIEYDVGDGPEFLEMMLEGNGRMRLRNPSEVTWTRVR